MAHQLQLDPSGMVLLTFIGDTDRQDAAAFIVDFEPILAAASPEQPLLVLWDDTRGGKASASARQIYADINSDPRIGKVAIYGARRYGRVLGEFVLKLTGRDNIRFFDTEAEARAWLTA